MKNSDVATATNFCLCFLAEMTVAKNQGLGFNVSRKAPQGHTLQAYTSAALIVRDCLLSS